MTADQTLSDPRELASWLESGCKPERDWRIGTEHEKFGFLTDSLAPLPYAGVRAVLEGLAEQFEWNVIKEDGYPIALSKADGCSITLEPGGQLELSGGLLDNLHQTCNEVNTHLAEVRAVAEPLGIGFLGMGFHPTARREDIEWMPKARYVIMRQYMPKVGSLGLDMMKRTCTVQVNLDFASEADMVAKFRASLALQPIATALFANSPFVEGKASGFLSYRSQVWTDTDPDRTGMLPWVFEESMGFERYVDWMLDVPMYFVRREGRYIDVAGRSFRDFLAGRLPGLEGQRPTLADWEDHLTTAFPEVRLKRFLEMRGADGGPWRRLCALPAFWVGLLYDSANLQACLDLCQDWSLEDRQSLREDVARHGLKAEIRGRSVRDIARELLALARQGLARRQRFNGAGDHEAGFLNDLEEIVERGTTPAEVKLEAFEGRWQGDLRHLFDEYAY
ncbi:glutamate--cysteine ligase [Wenzhouxiangella marina]|uniref:Glutamate--cysteine ligase n=1 Tax=Wenzhouxiangella marina TaxID=1579979 RepID=A0A0K0XSB3_9GAMM|nr:glutamate--cysteine ligase [Wenzhouxiangella marina]AKS40512.1 glutamate--cysteine ligase [Wenzhouxiangella marina]MBB6088166.1 glutamate--cysteine ligase [Wenzhouxiangella marina]